MTDATSFLVTVRKSDGNRRFYVGGCRVTERVYETVGDSRRDCFVTQDRGTHWFHYHCRRL